MIIDLSLVGVDQILSGLLITVIIALWHADHPSLSSDFDLRIIQRACGDRFLTKILTERNVSLDAFHSSNMLRGQGMYDLVRQTASRMIDFLPVVGQNFVLDFRKGIF